MAHDNSQNSGTGKGDRPSSLVERAAGKIIIDHARPLAAAVGPNTSTLSSGEGVGEDGRPELATTNPTRQALQDAALAAAVGPDGATREFQGFLKRESKLVNVDIAGLAARNIQTPQSSRNRMVEEMRLIKRMVLSRRWGDGDTVGNTIMVTSALPQEGKTTIAINLAMSIAAEKDLKVLLVDADFVKPDALRRLGVTADKGLIDVIQDSSLEIADVMLRTNIEKLSLIPAGQLHDRCTELLASARMSAVIAEMSRRYDDRILIFDSPPVLATTESLTLASHMGQIVFVVQAERTRRQVIESALELIGNEQHVGLVLNRARPRLGGTEFGSYHGAYYYQNDAGKQDQSRTGVS